jgi:hypothetical protein
VPAINTEETEARVSTWAVERRQVPTGRRAGARRTCAAAPVVHVCRREGHLLGPVAAVGARPPVAARKVCSPGAGLEGDACLGARAWREDRAGARRLCDGPGDGCASSDERQEHRCALAAAHRWVWGGRRRRAGGQVCAPLDAPQTRSALVARSKGSRRRGARGTEELSARSKRAIKRSAAHAQGRCRRPTRDAAPRRSRSNARVGLGFDPFLRTGQSARLVLAVISAYEKRRHGGGRGRRATSECVCRTGAKLRPPTRAALAQNSVSRAARRRRTAARRGRPPPAGGRTESLSPCAAPRPPP